MDTLYHPVRLAIMVCCSNGRGDFAPCNTLALTMCHHSRVDNRIYYWNKLRTTAFMKWICASCVFRLYNWCVSHLVLYLDCDFKLSALLYIGVSLSILELGVEFGGHSVRLVIFLVGWFLNSIRKEFSSINTEWRRSGLNVTTPHESIGIIVLL